MTTPSVPATAGQASTPSTPATPGRAANLVAREDLPLNPADQPTERATPVPRWALSRDSSNETVRVRTIPPRQRPLAPRPHVVAQRRTPSDIQDALSRVASSTAGPMDTVRADVQDSGRTRRISLSARPATSQDYWLTEEERAARRASAAARAANRASDTAREREESSIERADRARAQRAEDAATREVLEEGFAEASAAPWNESMWSRPSLGPQSAATTFAPWRRPDASRAQSLAEPRFGPNTMGPYGPIDPEARGDTKGNGRAVGVPDDYNQREKGKRGPISAFDPDWRKGVPKGKEPAFQDWSQWQPGISQGPNKGKGASTAWDRARSQGKGAAPSAPRMRVSPPDIVPAARATSPDVIIAEHVDPHDDVPGPMPDMPVDTPSTAAPGQTASSSSPGAYNPSPCRRTGEGTETSARGQRQLRLYENLKRDDRPKAQTLHYSMGDDWSLQVLREPPGPRPTTYDLQHLHERSTATTP
jgi:hypothetical protein